MKKILISIFIFFGIFIKVNASSNTLAKVGDKYYESLNEAIMAAREKDIIILMTNVKLDEGLDINKTVNINLNGNDITAPTAVFKVQGGSLNIIGTGIIKETEPNYGVIRVIGNNVETDEKYSFVSIGKNVTLEGWSGVFITHESSKSHGVYVNIEGNINAITDVNGDSGVGVYVNGNIKHEDFSPVINILNGSNISSNGTGLYIAGYSTFNIKDTNITGIESGVAIKSGRLNIDGISSIRGTGSDKTPTEGFNNGVKPSGAAIQIESNNGYAGNIEIDISNGTIKSDNSYAIYEYIGRGKTTEVKSFSISNGTFISAKENIKMSNSFNNLHSGFISGGKYSKNPIKYLKGGYSSNKDGTYYIVDKSTLNEIFTFNEKNITENNIFTKVIVLISLILMGILIYFNRTRVLNLIKK